MVTAIPLTHRRAAKLASPHHECIVEHPTLLEILHQCRSGLIDFACRSDHVLLDATVVCVGDFVTMLHTITELPSCMWCADASTLPLHEPIRIQFMPLHAGIPLKVQSVCLPFVLVKRPFGDQQTLDVRQCRFARIDREYATEAWKAHKKHRSKRKRK